MAWLILRSVRQRGLLPRLLRAAPPAPGEAPPIAVIVPARDEAANIGPCLQALVAQDYPASRMHVLVIDDHSADDTAAIVRRLAALNPHVSLIHAPPLPPRWVGKSHACWIGVRNVEPQCEWLCFIDADVKIAPAALSSALQAALAEPARPVVAGAAPGTKEFCRAVDIAVRPHHPVVPAGLAPAAIAVRFGRNGDRAVHAGAARCL